MKNLSFAVLAFLCGSSAFAQNLNLISEACDHSSKLESTGYVFNWNKQVYVLASADFVFNDSQNQGQSKFCHELIDKKGGTHPLQITRYDWGSGLVLLQGDDSLKPFAGPMSFVSPKLLMTASWEGGSGQVVSAHSKRHHFPVLNETLELKATDTDSHKVGSAIINPNGQIVGFITAQLIEEVPGQSARVARWLDRAGVKSQQLVIISSVETIRWLGQVLQANWASPFKIDPQDQLQKKYRVTVGNIAFTEDCPPPEDQPGSDPNYPIGGGDPVGIGGDSASAPACNFLVSKAVNPSLVDALPTVRKPWLTRLDAYLQKNVETSVMLGHYRDQNHELQSQALVSLGNFGQAILQPETGFLLRLKGENTPHEQELANLRLNARHVIAEVTRPIFVGIITVRQRGYLYGYLSLSDDWGEVSLQDLQSLYTDALNDDHTPHFVPDFVQAMIDCRKALQKP